MIQVVLAASNLLGLFSLKKSKDEGTFLMVVAVMLASCFMHLSETKHGLEPLAPFRAADSSLFLNLDRLVAVVAAMWFGTLLFGEVKAGNMTDDKFVSMLIVGLLGFMCMLVGELLSNQTLYMLLHLVWHASVYSIMYQLA